MSSEKLYNTPSEMSLRVLLLLDSLGASITVDRILAYDFMATYAKLFGIADSSLNGENNFAFCELPARRSLIKKALRNLIRDGLVLVRAGRSGILYKISEQWEIGRKFHSGYAEAYRENVASIAQHFGKVDDVKLFEEIFSQSIKLLRR